MSATDQPSILTVCVPGACVEADVSVSELIAARNQSALSARFGASDARVERGLREADCIPIGERCDGCDDSGCGMEPLTGSSIDLSSTRLSDSNGFGLVQSELSELEVSPGCKPSFFHADSGKKALELLRMLRFDLLVTGDQLPDMPVSQLIRRVRAAWPWQKWAMVGAAISPQDEISARTLGAMAVFDAPPDWEVLGSLAAKAAGRADGSEQARSGMKKVNSPKRTDGPHAASKPRRSREHVAASRTGRSASAHRALIVPHSAADRSQS